MVEMAKSDFLLDSDELIVFLAMLPSAADVDWPRNCVALSLTDSRRRFLGGTRLSLAAETTVVFDDDCVTEGMLCGLKIFEGIKCLDMRSNLLMSASKDAAEAKSSL